MGEQIKTIQLANPRGFCAGVDRAIEIVYRALNKYGSPVFVRNQVVHNRSVVENLKRRGAVFIQDLDEVPVDGLLIFSAHGVSRSVQEDAKKRGFRVFDATCPLVTKVHLEVYGFSQEGLECVLIGHAGHPEVEGTMGQFDTGLGGRISLIETVHDVESLEVRNPARLAYVTQTTLSISDTRRIIDALKRRFPEIRSPRKDDICYATQNRQDAVLDLASRNTLVLVVGSANSSNSNRLRELAEAAGSCSYLIDCADDIDPDWLMGVSRIGVTAGASAPESLVQEVVERLRKLGVKDSQEIPGTLENLMFSLPVDLRNAMQDS